jgi:hypothetical protein
MGISEVKSRNKNAHLNRKQNSYFTTSIGSVQTKTVMLVQFLFHPAGT